MDVQNFLTNRIGTEGLPTLNKEDWKSINAQFTPEEIRNALAKFIIETKPPYNSKNSIQNSNKSLTLILFINSNWIALAVCNGSVIIFCINSSEFIVGMFI